MTDKITYEADPSPEDIELLVEGLKSYNLTKVGVHERQSLTFFIRDAAGSITGGVHGNTGFGWLYISILWVKDLLRGKGCGTSLMEHAEREARERGCANAYLDTFSFQALEFYEKLGYTVFAELEDFPPGQSRYFLRKKLIQPGKHEKSADKV